MKNEPTNPPSEDRLPHATNDVGAQRPTAGPKHKEELLDEALEETFPASDPIAVGKTPRGER
jgi:hypothetical protein